MHRGVGCADATCPRPTHPNPALPHRPKPTLNPRPPRPQVCELLGRPPRAAALSGRRAREFFTREGRLRRIGRLNYWPLEAVLREKYRLPEDEVGRG